MTKTLLLVMTGGAIGAGARYLVGWAVVTIAGNTLMFPWATLGINIAGSFLIGLVWSVCADVQWFQEWGRALLVVGLLGGFTTFSTFSLETLELFEVRRVSALLYVLASMFGCLLAVALGYATGSAATS